MFEGKSVVVTGGSSGIGLAVAEAFASEGADVALVARDAARLETAMEVVAARRRSPAQRVLAHAADAAAWEGASGALAALEAEGLEPDVLVNSAGCILPGNFESMPVEHFAQNMESYFACVYASRAAVPGMISRGRGHIVNVSSVAGFIGVFGYTGYSAAKYAVMGFSESLRCEMKPLGVKVSVVCPPDTDTPGLTYEKTLRPPETDVIAGAIRPVPPALVAGAIVAAVKKGAYLVIPDLTSRFYWHLKGIAPGLFPIVFDGQVAKSRRERDLSA